MLAGVRDGRFLAVQVLPAARGAQFQDEARTLAYRAAKPWSSTGCPKPVTSNPAIPYSWQVSLWPPDRSSRKGESVSRRPCVRIRPPFLPKVLKVRQEKQGD